MLEIFTNMPQKRILCQNHGILAKYAKICWTKLGLFYTQNFLNRKKNIDMLKSVQPKKYAKAYYFAFLYLSTIYYNKNFSREQFFILIFFFQAEKTRKTESPMWQRKFRLAATAVLLFLPIRRLGHFFHPDPQWSDPWR